MVRGLIESGRGIARIALAGAVLVAGANGASALNIIGNIDNSGVPVSVAGGGTLGGVFNAAKSVWEAAITDNFNVTLNVSWGALSSGTLGAHSLVSQTFPVPLTPPWRETEGNIVLDNDGSTSWFVDATPFDSSEWTSFNEQTADLGGGTMNVGRVYSGATGDASGRFDLFTVLLHEIGHALGMSSANKAYQFEAWGDNDIDIGLLLPFAGAVLPTNNTGFLNDPGFDSNAHLKTVGTTLAGTDVLMQPTIGAGTRRMASDADTLAMCQLSGFTGCDLGMSVPEPATGLVVVAGIGLIGLLRRRRIAF